MRSCRRLMFRRWPLARQRPFLRCETSSSRNFLMPSPMIRVACGSALQHIRWPATESIGTARASGMVNRSRFCLLKEFPWQCKISWSKLRPSFNHQRTRSRQPLSVQILNLMRAGPVVRRPRGRSRARASARLPEASLANVFASRLQPSLEITFNWAGK